MGQVDQSSSTGGVIFLPSGHCSIWRYLGLAEMGQGCPRYLLGKDKNAANVLQYTGCPPPKPGIIPYDMPMDR